jgi:hypothetical protein
MTGTPINEMSHDESHSNSTKTLGSVALWTGLALATFAVFADAWKMFVLCALGAMVGLGFRVEGSVREAIARTARTGQNAPLTQDES